MNGLNTSNDVRKGIMGPSHPLVRSGACRGERAKTYVKIKPATKDRLASSILTDGNQIPVRLSKER